jgi:hypothetical protein
MFRRRRPSDRRDGDELIKTGAVTRYLLDDLLWFHPDPDHGLEHFELGRYFYARAEIAKAADAAALAAAAEISQRVFEETGDLQPTSKTWANAQAFASMNNSYLAQYGVNAVVTGFGGCGEDTVLVQVSANLERLFPI